jgi:hypothetical protein
VVRVPASADDVSSSDVLLRTAANHRNRVDHLRNAVDQREMELTCDAKSRVELVDRVGDRERSAWRADNGRV